MLAGRLTRQRFYALTLFVWHELTDDQVALVLDVNKARACALRSKGYADLLA